MESTWYFTRHYFQKLLMLWKSHQKQFLFSQRTKCNRTLYFIMRNLSKCPVNIKAQCYQTLVRPTLEYACPVWDHHYQGDIETETFRCPDWPFKIKPKTITKTRRTLFHAPQFQCKCPQFRLLSHNNFTVE